MKTCPACHRTYEDDSLTFCLDDGAALLAATTAADPNATLRMPEPRLTEPGATVAGPQAATLQSMKAPAGAPVVTSTSAVAASSTRKSPLPWILGIVIVLGVSGILIALIIARSLQQGSQQLAQTNAATPSPSQPAASNSPSPQSNSENARATPTPRPTPTPSRVTIIGTPNTAEEPPPPPPPTPRPTPRAPIAGGVLNGKAISLPKPEYPAIARAAHASGTVVVQVLIDEAGNVISAHATSGHPLLQGASVKAAYQAKFTPTKLSGQPVKVNGVIQYNFVVPMGR